MSIIVLYPCIDNGGCSAEWLLLGCPRDTSDMGRSKRRKSATKGTGQAKAKAKAASAASAAGEDVRVHASD